MPQPTFSVTLPLFPIHKPYPQVSPAHSLSSFIHSFIRLQRFHTTVPLLPLFLLSPIPACVHCIQGVATVLISHVPALIIWLGCCVEKDSVAVAGLSEREKGSGSKLFHGHQIECVLDECVLEGGGLRGRAQTTHLGCICRLCSRSRSKVKEVSLNLQVKLTFFLNFHNLLCTPLLEHRLLLPFYGCVFFSLFEGTDISSYAAWYKDKVGIKAHELNRWNHVEHHCHSAAGVQPLKSLGGLS